MIEKPENTDILEKLVIREWAVEDRPREKLLVHGRRALSNAELLAILIGSGSQRESAVDLCRRILLSVGNDLSELAKLEVAQLCEFRGIGEAKAISIIAALELGRRRKNIVQEDRPVMNSSKRVYEYLRPQLQDLPHEEFWVLYLNTACRLIDKQLIGRGGTDFTPVDIKTVLRFGIQAKSYSFILAHNHPSGQLIASPGDVQITERIKVAAEILDMRVNDHIIFTDDGYLSFKDEGML